MRTLSRQRQRPASRRGPMACRASWPCGVRRGRMQESRGWCGVARDEGGERPANRPHSLVVKQRVPGFRVRRRASRPRARGRFGRTRGFLTPSVAFRHRLRKSEETAGADALSAVACACGVTKNLLEVELRCKNRGEITSDMRYTAVDGNAQRRKNVQYYTLRGRTRKVR